MQNQPVVVMGETISAREAEVLAAVGEHLTNAEIAARLFISVRTVESHVSALLRKLGVADRRALATVVPEADPGGVPAVPALPTALTPFVGRTSERAELSAALRERRLVSAVGPGGVGKTRLALAVAADMVGAFVDGVWFVDLVPVPDGATIAPALTAAFRLGEQPGTSTEETVLSWLADRRALLVLDNCEHVLDNVADLLERLLTRAPGVIVLVTSRARLALPFEWVFPVRGLSLTDGDATELFLGRAEAAAAPIDAADRPRVERICRALEGVALAIELAAARLPAVGLDGLEDGLTDQLRLLTGARRAQQRHRSLRSTLDWSYQLLGEQAKAVLRRMSVFATPATVDAVRAVVGRPPVDPREVADSLAELADHSLLTPLTPGGGTRYRALETIRQYGTELLADAGELDECRAAHLRWCVAAGTVLRDTARTGDSHRRWRTQFDELADELRAALACANSIDRDEVAAAAELYAALCHLRGLTTEAQHRYEQAAALGTDPAAAALALHRAAGCAEVRLIGSDAVRLHEASAELQLGIGSRVEAARSFARAAELLNRAHGTLDEVPPTGAVEALLDRARALSDDDPLAVARIAIAEAFATKAWNDAESPEAKEIVERAVELARRCGDPLAESAALDRLTTVQLAEGGGRAAMATALRRIELLSPLPADADLGFEMSDAIVMATESALGAGELRTARRLAERSRDLPLHQEIAHVGVSRLLLVTAMAGDWDDTMVAAAQFRESWERAGRPRLITLRRCTAAVAAVLGVRGDEDTRLQWLRIEEELSATDGRSSGDARSRAFFEAMLHLHRGAADAAVATLATSPTRFRTWAQGAWQQWYAALWAESAVLAGHPEAADRLVVAATLTADNPAASVMVDRATALAEGDAARVAAAGARLEQVGCRYQAARSLVLAGGADAAAGAAAMKALGATH